MCRYAQAGTPQVKLQPKYDSSKKVLSIVATQNTSPTPGQDKKGPVLIPLKIALLGKDGKHLLIKLEVKLQVQS